MTISRLGFRYRKWAIGCISLQQPSALEIWVGSPEVHKFGEEGLKGRSVDLLEGHAVYVNVLVWRASAVVLAERAEEGGVHDVVRRYHADIGHCWLKGFEGLYVWLSFFLWAIVNGIYGNHGLEEEEESQSGKVSK